MSTLGYGVGGGLGTATEVTAGTGVAAAVWHSFVSESIKTTRAQVAQGSITGDRSTKYLDGMRACGGDVNFEFDGNSFGQFLYYWNGTASGAYASADSGGFFAAAPTGSASSGGSVPAGTYRYNVAPVWTFTLDGRKYLGPISAALTGLVLSGSQKADLAFTIPTPPTGFTYAGTAIYRTLGAAGTEKLVAYQAGATATYSDTAAAVDSGNYSPMAAAASAPRWHTYEQAFVAGTDPLPTFSTTVLQANDESIRTLLTKVNSFEIAVAEGNTPVKTKFGLIARDYEKIANPTPSVSDICKGMSWQAVIAINSTSQEIIEKLTIQGSNNCELIPGISGNARMRNVGYGNRDLMGSFDRQFEDHDYYDKMVQGQRFALSLVVFGQPLGSVSAGYAQFPISSTPVSLLSYLVIVDLFRCSVETAGANISGPGRMVETVSFKCETDSTEGTDMRVRLLNLAAAYS